MKYTHKKGKEMFMQFVATVHVLGLQVRGLVDEQGEVIRRARADRGSVTIEQVLWAVAVIAIASGVITAVTAFVKSKSSEIGD